MATRKKLWIIICSIFLLAAVVTIGVFAFSSQETEIEAPMEYTGIKQQCSYILQGTKCCGAKDSPVDTYGWEYKIGTTLVNSGYSGYDVKYVKDYTEEIVFTSTLPSTTGDDCLIKTGISVGATSAGTASDNSQTAYSSSADCYDVTAYVYKLSTCTEVNEGTLFKPNYVNRYHFKIVFYSPKKIYLPVNSSYFFSDSEPDYEDLFENLKSIDFSNADTSKVTNMQNMFSSCSSLTTLDLSSFNTSKVTDMSYMFYWCSSFTSLDLSKFDTSKVTDMSYMFYWCSSFTSLDLSCFDTLNVTNMSSMFYWCPSFTSLDLSNFDTSKVTNMNSMFSNCSKLTSLDLSNFNTSKVTNMSSMFGGCSKLTSLDLSNFNTSKVTNMSQMFDTCSSLTSLDLSSFTIGSSTTISGFFSFMSSDLGKMKLMVLKTPKEYLQSSTIDLPTGNWYKKGDASTSYTTLSSANTNCTLVKYGYGYLNSNWQTLISNAMATDTNFNSKVESLSFTYNTYDSSSLESDQTLIDVGTNSLDGTAIMDGVGTDDGTFQEYTAPLLQVSALVTKNNKSYYSIEICCSGIIIVGNECFAKDPNNDLNIVKAINTYWQLRSLSFVNIDTSNMTDMSYMFSYSKLTVLDISSFNMSNVTNMKGMFNQCKLLQNISFGKIDTSKVTDMSSMFSSCINLTSLDLSGFDTSNVTNMSSMFSSCSSLKKLNLSNSKLVQDFFSNIPKTLTEINLTDATITATDLSSAFSRFSSLTTLSLRNCDASTVTNMSSMFFSCSKLTSLDLSGFDTSNVTNMSYMFYGCSSLTSLDLTGFDTTRVKTMESMFSGCSSMASLDLTDFDTLGVTDMSNMFNGCSSLTSLDLTDFDTSRVTDMSSMFNGCSSLTSLDLRGCFTSSVTDMSSMFYNCSSLSNILWGIDPYNHFYFRRFLMKSLDTSNVIDMSYMFYNCSSLTSLDLTDFNFNTYPYTEVDLDTYHYIKSFDTSNVTNMSYMFYNCNQLGWIAFGENFTTNSVTNMSYMFYNCLSLTSLNLSSFDLSTCTSSSNSNLSLTTDTSLTRINTPSAVAYNIALPTGKWVALEDSVKQAYTEISSANCGKTLTKSSATLDSDWRTDIINGMDSDYSENLVESILFTTNSEPTFGATTLSSRISNKQNSSSTFGKTLETFGASDYTQIDVGDTSISGQELYAYVKKVNGKYQIEICFPVPISVSTCTSMFANFTGLTTLDLTNFYTPTVTDMSSMFSGCSSLESLDLNLLDMTVCSNVANIFNGTTNLKSIKSPSQAKINSSITLSLPTGTWKKSVDLYGSTYSTFAKGTVGDSGTTFVKTDSCNKAYLVSNWITSFTNASSVSATSINSVKFLTMSSDSSSSYVNVGTSGLGGNSVITEIDSIKGVYPVYAYYKSSGTGYAVEICSPSSIQIASGDSLFSGLSGLTEVITTNWAVKGTTAVNMYSGCSSLPGARIPASVTAIDSTTFSGCSSLGFVYFETGSLLTTIGAETFKNITTLTTVKLVGESSNVLPASVTSIGSGAFYGCTQLSNFTIPSRLTVINTSTFEMAGLTAITIPSGITKIGINAFCDCWCLANSIEIPASVTRIEQGAFARTVITGLTFANNSSLQYIGKYAFMGGARDVGYSSYYPVIGSVVLSSNITKIDDGAFANSKITSLTLTGNSTAIGNEAFKNCAYLGSVTMSGIASIGESCFVGSSISSFTVTNGVSTAIGNQAFKNCTSLGSVSMSGVASMGTSCFEGCSNLTTATHSGNSITSIGASAFKNCSSLETFTIPSGLTVINTSTFESSGLTSITIPSGITIIYDKAFTTCANLVSLTFEENSSLTSIGDPSFGINDNNDSFGSCTALTGEIKIPKNVAYIGRGSFYHTKFTKLTFETDSCLTTIGTWSFTGAPSSLSSMGNNGAVVFPSTLTTIGQGAFQYTGITSITLNGTSVTIGNQAFENCTSLGSVTMSGIASIGESAFESCTGMTTLTISGNNTVIGTKAFISCSSLTSVNITGLTGSASIGEKAFMNCSSLTSFTIPYAVKTLGKGSLAMKETSENTKSVNFSYSGTINQWKSQFGTTSIKIFGPGFWPRTYTIKCSDGNLNIVTVDY